MAKPNSKLRTLYDWLDYIERIHPKSIEMGLERIKKVWHNLNYSLSFPVVIVSGTNGKGTVCSILEAILSHAGYRVGCYTSPHLIRYNERIRINQQEVGNDKICQAFGIVESARINTNVPLTYFEFGTLTAMEIIIKAKVDIAILEVGLGGRLDAVNIFDAECAVLTNIDYDHIDYLGDTREKIGFEKAGIFRSNKTAICSEITPPDSIKKYAASIGSKLVLIGNHFGYIQNKSSWDYWGDKNKYYSLPYTVLGKTSHQLRNASACLAVLDNIKKSFPVTISNIHHGLQKGVLPGRFQVLPGEPVVILDVAHNPGAVSALSNSLSAMGSYQKTFAVFAVLNDKDIEGIVRAVISEIDIWVVADIDSSRGKPSDEIRSVLKELNVIKTCRSIFTFPDPISAYTFACKQATINDRICVFGSFYIVGKVMEYLKQERRAVIGQI